MKLTTSIKQLNRVGEALEKRLRRLGINTVRDLLMYFPFRYEDFSVIAHVSEVEDGQQVTIKGRVMLIQAKRSPRRRTFMTEAIIADDTGQLKVIWFGQPYIAKTMKVGEEYYFSGKITVDMFGIQLKSPGYEKVKKDGTTTHTARIVPLYPLTSGITHKQMRFLLDQVIDLAKEFEDWIPEDIQKKADIIPLAEAIRYIHFPDSNLQLKQAETRLKFDELFLLQLRAEMVRQALRRSKAEKISFREKETKEFVSSLSFELTKDQKVSAWEILQDMEKEEPMNRLLEGDVGSGKTVVAALVALNAILNHKQVVVMAPTEILARQHFASFSALLQKQNIPIALLVQSGVDMFGKEIQEKTKIGRKREVLESIKTGDSQFIVGTHALLSEGVEFHDLGLVIVDEQHRFGVDQRKRLKEKSGNKETTPHFLSMTATPIPRSFALALYGDLDISLIKTMPKGRKPIDTKLIEPHKRESAYDFIRSQVKEGRQVFVICPLIEENKENEKKSVMSEYTMLAEKIFPDLRVGYLHGKMKPKEKDDSMNAFVQGEIDILVSTSVV
ncbi:MAG: ATP-dependent DNA helicase RecG, partial [Candidatus Magasanikbacteria bacterium]